MSKGKKMKKNKWKMPPLSRLDTCLYVVMIVAAVFLIFLFIYLYVAALARIPYYFTPEALGIEHSDASALLILPLVLYAGINFARFIDAFHSRRPIFGLRGFQYGPPQWPAVYPLFSSQRPQQKGGHRQWILPCLSVCLLTLVLTLACLSIWGRSCLYPDGSVHVYNIINQETKHYASEEIDSLKIKTSMAWGKARNRWQFTVSLITESGKEFSFDYGSPSPDTFCGLIQIKSTFAPNQVQVEGAENLDKVIREWDLGEEQRHLLYQLFEVD